MTDRFAQFPRALRERARAERAGDVPLLLAHPDWLKPAPVVVWLHGRTVSKELDPGRYLRWVRAGIAACAIDLPGHGERADPALREPGRSLDVLLAALPEIDRVLEFLAEPRFGSVIDLDRVAIGGMSLGGMTALRRLCDDHPFVCAAVESTTGWLEGLYFPERWGAPAATPRWPVLHNPALVARADASAHLRTFRPLPLLALHSASDEVVPFGAQDRFIERLREHYASQGADPTLIEIKTWERTGAENEHNGFGRFANDAKNAQTAFFARWLRPDAPAHGAF